MKFAASTNSGLEEFVDREIKRSLQAYSIKRTQSFVRFETNYEPSSVLSLRTIENAYVGLAELDERITAQFPGWDAVCCFDAISQAITEKDWENAINVWQHVTGIQHEPAFRVSCKRIGARSKHFKSPDVATHLGVSLRQRFGLVVDLHCFDMEVYARVEDTFVFVGIALNTQRLTSRSDVVVEGLRGSAACALAMLADPHPGDIVLDPMCGKGALLFEACRMCPSNLLVGADISNSQLRIAEQNSISTRAQGMMVLLKADARSLPLPDAFVDVIICDLPFGKKFGSPRENKELYPRVIKECIRLLHPKRGRMVLLTSKKQSSTLMNALDESNVKHTKQYRLKLGNMESTIVYACIQPQYESSNISNDDMLTTHQKKKLSLNINDFASQKLDGFERDDANPTKKRKAELSPPSHQMSSWGETLSKCNIS
eukprot:gene8871-1222_t